MTDIRLHHYLLCNDFGPMSLASVIKFVRQLESKLEANPDSTFFYCVEMGQRPLTNAVFLLGTYMILRLGFTVDEVSGSFSWLDRTLVEPFRDATYSESDFDLTGKFIAFKGPATWAAIFTATISAGSAASARSSTPACSKTTG